MNENIPVPKLVIFLNQGFPTCKNEILRLLLDGNVLVSRMCLLPLSKYLWATFS